MPPTPDRVDRETGCVVIYSRACPRAGLWPDPWADPARVARDIVDTIRRRTAKFGDFEVMHPNRVGFAFRTQFTARVLEVTHQFLLFGVYRNCRHARRESGFHLRIDVPELRIVIR